MIQRQNLKQWANDYVRLPMWAWLLMGLLVLYATTTANFAYTVVAVIFPFFMTNLLWRSGEPPVLAFILFVQWLQVATKVFHANFMNIELLYMFGSPMIEPAFEWAMWSLLALGLGMRSAFWNAGPSGYSEHIAHSDAAAYSIRRLFYLLIAVSIFFNIAWSLLGGTGFRAILDGLMSLKWAAVFVFAYVVHQQKQGYGLLGIVFLFEVISGFTGFFSEFKIIFIILILVMMTVGYRFSIKTLLPMMILASMAVYLVVMWSAVKMEYREFLNQGEMTQAVQVDVGERLGYLADKAWAVDGKDLDRGMDALLARIGYIDYLAHTMEYVPYIHPHEEGVVWKSAIQHVLMPRILFPDKAVLDDSEVTRRYTGLHVAGDELGTSISLGYVAESYIDFGVPGFLVPIFLLGLVVGLIYRWLVIGKAYGLIRYGLSVPVFLSLMFFETALPKMLGGFMIVVVLVALTLKFVVPTIHHWLTHDTVR